MMLCWEGRMLCVMDCSKQITDKLGAGARADGLGSATRGLLDLDCVLTPHPPLKYILRHYSFDISP
jgi:hypothetical protein